MAAAVASRSESDYDYDDKDESFDVVVVISDIGSDNDDDNLAAQPSDSCIERKMYCSVTTLYIKTECFKVVFAFSKPLFRNAGDTSALTLPRSLPSTNPSQQSGSRNMKV